MIISVKLIGFLLLILVGYHYINKSLGFSVAESVAISIFSLCLMMLYHSYEPDRKNGIGWMLIIFGCLILSTFKSLSIMLFVPIFLIVAGYLLADLPYGFPSNLGSIDSGGDGGSGDGDGDGGCGGGGD